MSDPEITDAVREVMADLEQDFVDYKAKFSTAVGSDLTDASNIAKVFFRRIKEVRGVLRGHPAWPSVQSQMKSYVVALARDLEIPETMLETNLERQNVK